MKSNQLRPSGALVPLSGRREERLHGKCGDWRTFLSYPAFLLKRKQDRCYYASYSLSLNHRKQQRFRSLPFATGSIIIRVVSDDGQLRGTESADPFVRCAKTASTPATLPTLYTEMR